MRHFHTTAQDHSLLFILWVWLKNNDSTDVGHENSTKHQRKLRFLNHDQFLFWNTTMILKVPQEAQQSWLIRSTSLCSVCYCVSMFYIRAAGPPNMPWIGSGLFWGFFGGCITQKIFATRKVSHNIKNITDFAACCGASAVIKWTFCFVFFYFGKTVQHFVLLFSCSRIHPLHNGFVRRQYVKVPQGFILC